jgi:hypothetical protein
MACEQTVCCAFESIDADLLVAEDDVFFLVFEAVEAGLDGEEVKVVFVEGEQEGLEVGEDVGRRVPAVGGVVGKAAESAEDPALSGLGDEEDIVLQVNCLVEGVTGSWSAVLIK